MVRKVETRKEASLRSPHPRGDGPFTGSHYQWQQMVLPTRVGMVRLAASPFSKCESSPHPRGDGPPVLIAVTGSTEFSPPAWGWSEKSNKATLNDSVLPTRVGMVRLRGRYRLRT